MGPLEGVRVVDMTTVLMGPYATQMLGDMGADVIKVESPEGDLMRQITPYRNAGMSALYLNANRNKRSICLDLKNPAGRDALLELVKQADVLVYNIRPQAMKRLGLDYETLSALNPRLIYAGVYGFGQNGPYASKAAYDDLIQGAAVLPSLIAQTGDGTPRYVPSAIADRIVGLAAVGAITATLVNRDRTGRGQELEIPMFETMVHFVMGDHLAGLTFEPPAGKPGYSRLLSRHRRPYQTKDGYICALVYNDKHWRSFLKATNHESLMTDDPRFASFASRAANIDDVYAMLVEIFAERSTEEWLQLLEQADIPVMPMHDMDSILKDPHLVATQFFETMDHPSEGPIKSMRNPIRWSDTRPDTPRPAPRHGQDGIDVFREMGMSDEEIRELVAAGALIMPE